MCSKIAEFDHFYPRQGGVFMNYKEFLTTKLFEDADIVVIQDQNGMIQDIKNYKKIRNKEILSYETDIDNDLVITTLTMEF